MKKHKAIKRYCGFLRFSATPKHMSANDVPPVLDENSPWRNLNKAVTNLLRPTQWDNCDSNSRKSSSNPELDDVIFQKLTKCLDRIQTAGSRNEVKLNKKSCCELDTLARIIFPASFVLFNIVYWSIWPIKIWSLSALTDKSTLNHV